VTCFKGSFPLVLWPDMNVVVARANVEFTKQFHAL